MKQRTDRVVFAYGGKVHINALVFIQIIYYQLNRQQASKNESYIYFNFGLIFAGNWFNVN